MCSARSRFRRAPPHRHRRGERGHRLFVVWRRDLLALMARQPGVAVQVIELLCARIRWMSAETEEAAFLSLECRLARRLRNLAADYGDEITISQEELAVLVGATRPRERQPPPPGLEAGRIPRHRSGPHPPPRRAGPGAGREGDVRPSRSRAGGGRAALAKRAAWNTSRGGANPEPWGRPLEGRTMRGRAGTGCVMPGLAWLAGYGVLAAGLWSLAAAPARAEGCTSTTYTDPPREVLDCAGGTRLTVEPGAANRLIGPEPGRAPEAVRTRRQGPAHRGVTPAARRLPGADAARGRRRARHHLGGGRLGHGHGGLRRGGTGGRAPGRGRRVGVAAGRRRRRRRARGRPAHRENLGGRRAGPA